MRILDLVGSCAAVESDCGNARVRRQRVSDPDQQTGRRGNNGRVPISVVGR